MSEHPFSTAKKVRRSSNGFRRTCGDVAAVDFGTSSVSLSYSTAGDDNVATVKLDQVRHLYRVPNAILIKRENAKVIGIGYMAQDHYLRIKVDDKEKYVYFQRIKMMLKRDKVCY